MKTKTIHPTRKAMNLFFLLFLAIGSILAGSIALLYRAELNTFLLEIQAQERHSLGRQNVVIKDKFDSIVSDLIFLSQQNELLKYLEIDDTLTEKDVEVEYIAMSLAKRIYDQIRYLSADGMEKVRVNFNNGEAYGIPNTKLQSKSKRYYFTDAFMLEEKEIFVSPLDLNIERGEVERPLKPMIRFGTPVFDNKGTKRGIVLLNYLADDLLNLIENELSGEKNVTMLVNDAGYWLLHSEKDKEWGFMFEDRKDITFASEFPEEWRIFRKQKDGQIKTKNGLFTFTTIYPLQEGFRSSSGSGEPYKPSVSEVDPSQYYWVLVSQIPATVMAGHTRAVMSRLFLIGAGLFILISFGAWQLALSITKRRIYQAQLIEMALYDPLTNLPNRKLFFDKLDEGISHAGRYKRRFGLLYIDLDGFKNVNDSMGHDAGDELLVKVGMALKGIVRESDTVARLGGDEFAVIISEIKKTTDAKLVGERMVAEMCKAFQLNAGIARIGASIGVAIFPDDEDEMGALIKHADSAMYKAKAEGKNTCVMAFNEDS